MRDIINIVVMLAKQIKHRHLDKSNSCFVPINEDVIIDVNTGNVYMPPREA